MPQAMRPEDRRKVPRLDTIFPIEFQVVDNETRHPLSELKEGFTRDIGATGMGIFAKTLKGHEKELFSFVPHETKLKLLINVPVDQDPIECFATVEWVEKKQQALTDEYLFGVSYDFINEFEYERIMAYVRWLRLRPRIITAGIILLAIGLIAVSYTLYHINERKIQSEKRLAVSVQEGKKAERARLSADNARKEMENALMREEQKRQIMQTLAARLAREKKKLSELSARSEEDRQKLETQLEEYEEEPLWQEEDADIEVESAVEETETQEFRDTQEPDTKEEEGNEERIRSEAVNYARFRESILNEKIQSLDAYLSAHPSSIYHAAALFALAELRYKYGEKGLAEVNYDEVIELYPNSKYALYSSHRLEQIGKNYNYDYYTLKHFCDTYGLPEFYDYRNVEPYIQE